MRFHCAPRSARSPQGFTLVEAILVMVILAILSSIAVPRYAGFVSQQHLEGTARKITADLSYAQRQARQSSASRTVVFDVALNKYTLVGINDPDHKAQPFEVRLAEEPYRARLISASFGGDAQLVYNGFGTPDSNGTVVVAVGSTQKSITVDAGSGRAKKGGAEPVQGQ